MTGKILKYNNITPTIKKNVFIAEGSKIIGNVEINEGNALGTPSKTLFRFFSIFLAVSHFPGFQFSSFGFKNI